MGPSLHSTRSSLFQCSLPGSLHLLLCQSAQPHLHTTGEQGWAIMKGFSIMMVDVCVVANGFTTAKKQHGTAMADVDRCSREMLPVSVVQLLYPRLTVADAQLTCLCLHLYVLLKDAGCCIMHA